MNRDQKLMLDMADTLADVLELFVHLVHADDVQSARAAIAVFNQRLDKWTTIMERGLRRTSRWDLERKTFTTPIRVLLESKTASEQNY